MASSTSKILVEFKEQDRRLMERIARALEKSTTDRLENESRAMFNQYVHAGKLPELPTETVPGSDFNFAVSEEAFANAEGTVIFWKGDNFHKGCGHPVTFQDDDSPASTCVLPINHGGVNHVDWDGVLTMKDS